MSTENKNFNALPDGYILNDYRIIRVLGSGGFGIAYLAEDIELSKMFVIKEYLPNDFSFRDQSSKTIYPKDPSQKENYEWGLKEYINEARTIAKFNHPNIVQVVRYFKKNNTAYFVMPYIEGKSLSELLSTGETATEEEIKSIIIPLLEGLQYDVHKNNILHRDIKPSNIYIQDKGNIPILIDFGAARSSLSSHSRSVTSIITPGYSPYEQYQTRGNQGAWTDIYAMGAVMYRLISGAMPIEASARVMDDPLVPATQIGHRKYSRQLLEAIDHALVVREAGRPQSVSSWIAEINGKSTAGGADLGGGSGSENTGSSGNNAGRNTDNNNGGGGSTVGNTSGGMSGKASLPTAAWIIIIVLVASIAILSAYIFSKPTSPSSNSAASSNNNSSNNTFSSLVEDEITRKESARLEKERRDLAIERQRLLDLDNKRKEREEADRLENENEREADRQRQEAERKRKQEEESRKDDDKSAAVAVIMKYYTAIARKDIDTLLELWKDSSSEGAQKAKRILSKGGGKCEVLAGSKFLSYSEYEAKIFVILSCDEGSNRRDKRYKVNFVLEKVGSNWRIVKFYSN